MEGKRNSSSFLSTGDDVLGRKAANPSARSSSSSSGYFSTVIPPASTVIAKDLSHSDLCWTLNMQKNDGRIIGAQSTPAGNKSTQGIPTQRQSTQNKDAKSAYSGEYIESSYFGSSVNYGARDFYTSSSSPQTSKSSDNYRVDEGADLGNTHVADRGEWWQGSLYY